MQTRGQLPGILGGLALTLFLHVAAGFAVLIVAAIAGEARPGSEAGLAIVILFVAGLALWQWAYLAPAAWLARPAGFEGLAKGLLIGGGVGVLATALWYGGQFAAGLAMRLSPPPPAPKPAARALDVKGVVESFEGGVLVVRRDAGVVRLRVSPSTEYVLLTAPAGHRREGPAIVKPGARVSVDAWRSGPEPTASIVRVVEDGRALP